MVAVLVIVSAILGAIVLIVYFPLVVSFVVRIEPSSETVSSLNPGVASTVISIGELTSTVDEGAIVRPYVATVVTCLPNLISGEVAIGELEPSRSFAIKILFSCVIPVIFLVKIPLSSEITVPAS